MGDTLPPAQGSHSTDIQAAVWNLEGGAERTDVSPQMSICSRVEGRLIMGDTLPPAQGSQSTDIQAAVWNLEGGTERTDVSPQMSICS